jgi:uncharacterized protein
MTFFRNKLSLISIAVAILLLLVVPLAVDAASFGCAKAKTSAEKTICADQELSKLDEELGQRYAASLGATAREKDKAQLRLEQKEWLKSRDACQSALCFAESYRQRIAKLQADTPPAQSDATDGRSACRSATGTIRAKGGKPFLFYPPDKQTSSSSSYFVRSARPADSGELIVDTVLMEGEKFSIFLKNTSSGVTETLDEYVSIVNVLKIENRVVLALRPYKKYDFKKQKHVYDVYVVADGNTVHDCGSMTIKHF